MEAKIFSQFWGWASYWCQSLMQKLPWSLFVRWLLNKALASLVAFIVICIIFNLAHVFIVSFFIIFDNNSITTSRWGIRKLVLLVSFIEINIFFGKTTKSLPRLVAYFNITISSKRIIFFRYLFLLVLEFLVF